MSESLREPAAKAGWDGQRRFPKAQEEGSPGAGAGWVLTLIQSSDSQHGVLRLLTTPGSLPVPSPATWQLWKTQQKKEGFIPIGILNVKLGLIFKAIPPILKKNDSASRTVGQIISALSLELVFAKGVRCD